MGVPLKLVDITPDQLIDRVYNGENPSRIATDLGVTKAAVYYHIAQHPEYVKARQTGMSIRLDDAESEIKDSPDHLSLSRGREAFRAVAWRAEHEFPAIWGGKPTIELNINQIGEISQALNIAASDLLGKLRQVGEKPVNNQDDAVQQVLDKPA